MKIDDARALIAGAVPRRAGVWADLGAGDGTFTQALARFSSPAAASTQWIAIVPLSPLLRTRACTESRLLPWRLISRAG